MSNKVILKIDRGNNVMEVIDGETKICWCNSRNILEIITLKELVGCYVNRVRCMGHE